MKVILVTGSTGFIVRHTARSLLECRDWVIGLDNHNNHYDNLHKQVKLKQLEPYGIMSGFGACCKGISG